MPRSALPAAVAACGSVSKSHPINIYHPEGEYLKGLVLYVE